MTFPARPLFALLVSPKITSAYRSSAFLKRIKLYPELRFSGETASFLRLLTARSSVTGVHPLAYFALHGRVTLCRYLFGFLFISHIRRDRHSAFPFITSLKFCFQTVVATHRRSALRRQRPDARRRTSIFRRRMLLRPRRTFLATAKNTSRVFLPDA